MTTITLAFPRLVRYAPAVCFACFMTSYCMLLRVSCMLLLHAAARLLCCYCMLLRERCAYAATWMLCYMLYASTVSRYRMPILCAAASYA